jgi:hypothetical protein
MFIVGPGQTCPELAAERPFAWRLEWLRRVKEPKRRMVQTGGRTLGIDATPRMVMLCEAHATLLDAKAA